jgi:prevent-host-death family protein
MRSIKVHEAKTNLSKLIEQARRGEEVIIARGATPVVRLVPVGEVQGRRQPGALRGKLRVGPEFSQPLPAGELSPWE